MAEERGQAMVEAALVLPLLLLVAVGVIGTGLVLRQGLVLQHVANEAAVAGAQQSCSVVPARAAKLLGRSIETTCSATGQQVTVTVIEPTAFVSRLFPDWSLTIGATGRATIRDAEPTATP